MTGDYSLESILLDLTSGEISERKKGQDELADSIASNSVINYSHPLSWSICRTRSWLIHQSVKQIFMLFSVFCVPIHYNKRAW